MKTIFPLICVFLFGCMLTYFINGKPDAGYEKLWYASIPVGGLLFAIPVILFLFVKFLLRG